MQLPDSPEIIDLSCDISCKRVRSCSSDKPAPKKQKRTIDEELESRIESLAAHKSEPDFPLRCSSFALVYLEEAKECVPQSTGRGKILKKILQLGIACNNVGYTELKRYRHNFDEQLANDGRAKTRSWFSFVERARSLPVLRSIGTSSLEAFKLSVSRKSLAPCQARRISHAPYEQGSRSSACGSSDKGLQKDNGDIISLPEDVFECFTEHGGENSSVSVDSVNQDDVYVCNSCKYESRLGDDEWSECLECGKFYCTECDLRWINFQ